MNNEMKSIHEIFAHELNKSVKNIERLSEGSYNKVYKISTDTDLYFLRVFPKGGTQDLDSIKYLEKLLYSAFVLFPKTLFCSSDDTYFLYGASIKGDNLFTPVLTHGDLNSNNILIDGNQNYYILDWDYAMPGIWINDFANMTYWSSKITDEIKVEFLNGYGEVTLAISEALRYEKLFHKIIALDYLKWLYFDKKDMEEFHNTLMKYSK